MKLGKYNLLLTILGCVLGAAAGSLPAIAQSLVYVTNDNTVSVINTSTNTVVATVPVGNGSNDAVALTPGGAMAYVTNYYDNTVSVINTSTNTVVATVPVGNGPDGVAITPSGAFAYVSNSSDDTVSVIDTAANTVVATAPAGTDPNSIVFSPNGAFAYVVNDQAVTVINTATNAIAATVSVPAGPGSTDGPGVAITPNGLFVYVSGGYGVISVVSTQTNAVVDTFYPPTGAVRGSSLGGIAIAPNGALGYAAVGGEYEIEVFDTTTNSVTTTIPVGAPPTLLAISPDGAYVYGTSSCCGAVFAISTATNTVVTAIPVANGPYAVAFATPLYHLCLLYDPTKAVHSGATIPIKLQLCDGTGIDLSSSSTALHATNVTQISTSITGPVENPGNANPDDDFRFDSTLGSTGGYIFNLQTTGLTTGTYNLNFTVTGDSSVYAAPFQVK